MSEIGEGLQALDAICYIVLYMSTMFEYEDEEENEKQVTKNDKEIIEKVLQIRYIIFGSSFNLKAKKIINLFFKRYSKLCIGWKKGSSKKMEIEQFLKEIENVTLIQTMQDLRLGC